MSPYFIIMAVIGLSCGIYLMAVGFSRMIAKEVKKEIGKH